MMGRSSNVPSQERPKILDVDRRGYHRGNDTGRLQGIHRGRLQPERSQLRAGSDDGIDALNGEMIYFTASSKRDDRIGYRAGPAFGGMRWFLPHLRGVSWTGGARWDSLDAHAG